MEDIVIDSAMTREEALAGLAVPSPISDALTLVDVGYLSFDGKRHAGQILVHASLAEEVESIFADLYALRFPIRQAIPIARYAWNDDASMADNNSSVFNYRFIYGTQTLSNHSFGRAIDINPLLNPYIARDGTVHPAAAVYDPTRPGTFDENGAPTEVFLSRGWEWGGHWTDRKDWQHFQKLA